MLSKTKYNKSTYFLLPLFGINFGWFNQGNDAFINTYLYCKIPEITLYVHQYKKKYTSQEAYRFLFVLLDKYKIDVEALESIKTNRHLVTIFYQEDYVICLLRSYYMREYVIFNTFEAGLYSRFSKEYKDTIRDYIQATFVNENGKRIPNPNYEALFPNESSRNSLSIILGVKVAKDAEIISSPYKEDETLVLTYE